MQRRKNGKNSWIVRKIHLRTRNGQMRTNESSTISRRGKSIFQRQPLAELIAPSSVKCVLHSSRMKIRPDWITLRSCRSI
jgi:hypothetical protein